MILDNIEKLTNNIIENIITGNGKVIIFGNGGSAAEADHVVAEFLGKYNMVRRALPAISLCNSLSTLTAISNDMGYDHIFKRQLSALAQPDDIVIGISTSGSHNINKALDIAKDICNTYLLTCQKNISVNGVYNNQITILNIPVDKTSIAQELNLIMWHSIFDKIDKHLKENP